MLRIVAPRLSYIRPLRGRKSPVGTAHVETPGGSPGQRSKKIKPRRGAPTPAQIRCSHRVALTGLIRLSESTPDFRLGFLKGTRLRRLGILRFFAYGKKIKMRRRGRLRPQF